MINEDSKTIKLSPERKKELKDFQMSVKDNMKDLSQVSNTGSSENYHYPTILYSLKLKLEELMESIKDEFGEA